MKTRFTRFMAAALALTLVLSLGGMASVGSAEGSTEGEKTKLVPVSYTHLDVYKRQPMSSVIPATS